MKRILYLMRHGETSFNRRKIIQGWCDSPLTEKGIEQAQASAKYFDNIVLTHAYASTSERASDTLEHVTRNKMPYKRLKDIREINFGILEGESEDLIPDISFYEEKLKLFGGETYLEFMERVEKCLHSIMNQDGHDSVLMLSHGGVCVMYLAHLIGPEACRKIVSEHFGNCHLLKFEYDVESKTFHFLEYADPTKAS